MNMNVNLTLKYRRNTSGILNAGEILKAEAPLSKAERHFTLVGRGVLCDFYSGVGCDGDTALTP